MGMTESVAAALFRRGLLMQGDEILNEVSPISYAAQFSAIPTCPIGDPTTDPFSDPFSDPAVNGSPHLGIVTGHGLFRHA